jgi:hypothetical protein
MENKLHCGGDMKARASTRYSIVCIIAVMNLIGCGSDRSAANVASAKTSTSTVPPTNLEANATWTPSSPPTSATNANALVLAPDYHEIVTFENSVYEGRRPITEEEWRRFNQEKRPTKERRAELLQQYYTSLAGTRVERWEGWVCKVIQDQNGTAERPPTYLVYICMDNPTTDVDEANWPEVSLSGVSRDEAKKLRAFENFQTPFARPTIFERVVFSGLIDWIAYPARINVYDPHIQVVYP